MIYLDVTSSCKSPMNTGVQRVVRELFRALSAKAPVTPLIWDQSLKAYCTLSRRERGFLEHPFRGGGDAASAEPGRRANPVPVLSKLWRQVMHRWNRLDLPGLLTAADTLFVPEIFQDGRVPFLAELARRSPARRVAVCHDAIAWSRPDITPPRRQGGFKAYLETLGTFDHVVAISRETAAALETFWQAHGQGGAAVSVHPWPVNHAGVVRQVLPASAQQPPQVLCVGTLEPRKNHLTLLTACELAWSGGANFALVLVGRTTAQWGDRVLAVVERLGRAGRPVHWLKHVDDTTLRQGYADCAFTVFPSLIEGFGLPILESLWHGRPCVCGSNGALGEVSAGGGCLPVNQTDPTAVAGSITRLLSDTSLYQTLCQEAEARQFGTWEALADNLLPLLKSSGSEPV